MRHKINLAGEPSLISRGSSAIIQLNLKNMLYTIALVLIILWLLGVVTGSAIGGFIHILLVIAIIMVLVNFISGRK